MIKTVRKIYNHHYISITYVDGVRIGSSRWKGTNKKGESGNAIAENKTLTRNIRKKAPTREGFYWPRPMTMIDKNFRSKYHWVFKIDYYNGFEKAWVQDRMLEVSSNTPLSIARVLYLLNLLLLTEYGIDVYKNVRSLGCYVRLAEKYNDA